jgi:hypothetical protein
MYQPSTRRIAALLSSRLPRPGLGAAVFCTRVLLALAVPTHVLATSLIRQRRRWQSQTKRRS